MVIVKKVTKFTKFVRVNTLHHVKILKISCMCPSKNTFQPIHLMWGILKLAAKVYVVKLVRY